MKEKIKYWVKRFGIAGLIFFVVKGLITLAIFLGAGKMIFD